MSTVKISELPEIVNLNANTQQSLAVGVDIVTGVTGKYTLRTLAEGLYSNDVLNVGNNEIIFPNVIAQFVSSADPYLQVNVQNLDGNGSTDMVLTADTGTDTEGFVDLGINGSTFDQPAFTSMGSLDGYLFAVGPSGDTHKGNLVIGTASTDANVVFAVGGTAKENIVARMTNTGFTLNGASFLTFADSSTQAVAAAPANYTQSAYNRANTASANTVIIQGVNLEQNASISQVNTFAGSAYNKANNALANTTGTFGGNLTVAGNTQFNGFIDVINSQISNNAPLVQINASDDGSYVAPSNSYYMLHITGKANNTTRFVVDSFGANTYPLISGRMARGSAAAPAATANGDVLMRVVGNGYTGTQFPTSSPTKIDFVATENFSNTNRGTEIQFWNTTVGSNTLTKIATFNANEVTISGHLTPQKGFIWYPRTFPAAQTAITIDFASDSLIRTNTSTGLTVSFTNYTAGKVVDMWITNTAGTGQTFTHGCSALNSTVNSTTFNIPATSTIYVKYISFDGDVGNTFCAITHA